MFISIHSIRSSISILFRRTVHFHLLFKYGNKLGMHQFQFQFLAWNWLDVRKVSSGFEYFLLIFALRLGLTLKVVGLDAELNSLSNSGIFNEGHRAKKEVRVKVCG